MPPPHTRKRAAEKLRRPMIGVLGGMGPAATVDFLSKVVALTPASCDQDHVPLLIYQASQIPDRSAAILAGSDEPFLALLNGLKKLKRAGAGCAVIPCNTAHFWYDRLAAARILPLLHIADSVIPAIQASARTCTGIGVLGTRATSSQALYERRLGSRFGRFVAVDEETQSAIDEAIALVKAGHPAIARPYVRAAIDRLRARGASTVILACTELPVALGTEPSQPTVIDSTLTLAQACVAYHQSAIQGRRATRSGSSHTRA